MRIIRILLCLIVSLVLLAGCAPKGDEGMLGSGTALDPYQVATASDLNDVRNDLTAYYIQTANIDLSGYANWLPIGTKANPFTGGYNGNNLTIDTLVITMNWGTNDFGVISSVGLFGFVDSTNYIKNVRLTNVDIALQGYRSSGSGTGYSGTLIGYTDTCHDISSCHASGEVSFDSSAYFGGLIGGAEPSDNEEVVYISSCSTNITLNGNCLYYIGGFIGYAYGDSLVAPVNLKIENCVSIITTTNADESGSYYVGGFIGQAGNTVVNKCASTINMEGSLATDDVGGVGGFIGNADDCVISNCYSRGSIAGEEVIGGFIGDSWQTNTITNCYSACAVNGGTDVGGFIGSIAPDDVVTSCYYDSEASGQSDNDGRGIPKTTAEMKTQSTFVDWDFSNVWVLDSGNDGYPHFGSGGATANFEVYDWHQSAMTQCSMVGINIP